MKGIKAVGPVEVVGETRVRQVAKSGQRMTFWFEVNGEIVDLREKFEASFIAVTTLTMIAIMLEVVRTENK